MSGVGGILLQAELYQSVRRATAPGASCLVQVYRLVNAGSAPLTFKWHEVWDADLFWHTGLADDWNNDEVDVGAFDGRKYVRLGEFGMPAALEWRLTLNAGEQTALTLVHTYGQPTPMTYLPADTNGDGCVDDADLLNVLVEFGGASSGAAQTDVNSDGVVDDADLLQVLFAFGSGC